MEFALGGRGKYRGLIVTVDDEDWPEVSQHRWYGHRPPGSRTTYVRGIVNGRPVSLHRFLLGQGDDYDIDHGDGNGLNNSRANLERVTRGENVSRAYKRFGSDYRRVGHYVKPVRKRLASGEVRIYLYDRRTMKRLTEREANEFRKLRWKPAQSGQG